MQQRPSKPRPSPWIETPQGGLFFVNVLLITPLAVILLPLVVGALLRTAGLIQGPSRIFDTIPFLAWHFAPRLGWLAAPAAWLAWRTLRMVERKGPRLTLAVFLALHMCTVAYTVYRWSGG